MAEQSLVADTGAELKALLGLDTVDYRVDLSKDELFAAAIAGDRGRVTHDGPGDAQKAFATKLGAEGPLVYYTDPDCTGRPVKDTFAVARPELVSLLGQRAGRPLFFRHDLSLCAARQCPRFASLRRAES